MHAATASKIMRESMTEYELKLHFKSSIPKTKLVLYFDACRSRFASRFLRDCTRKAIKQLDSFALNGGNKHLGFCEEIRFLFEKLCPNEFLEQVNKHGLKFAKLEGLDLEEAKRVLQLYKAL